MMIKRRIWKWLGYSSTLFLFICDFTPRTFNIPADWCPWLFLISILWFFLVITGFFIP
jgi:hypothetical protein